MSEIPGDVWACGQVLWFYREGRLTHAVAAYLLRAASNAEALTKARAIAEHDTKRIGGAGFSVFANKSPGEGAMGGINNDPLLLDPMLSDATPDPAPDATAEARL